MDDVLGKILDLFGTGRVEQTTVTPSAPSGRRPALARRRREVCKTQEGLAMEIGVERTTVARWESGGTTPSLWARPRLANALDVTLEGLDSILTAAPVESRTLRVVEPADAAGLGGKADT